MQPPWLMSILVVSLVATLGWVGMGAHAWAQESKTLAQFLAEKRDATMATIRPDGTPQLSPVWFYWDGEKFYISMTRDRVKYKNLARDPRMSLCIDDVTGFTYIEAKREGWPILTASNKNPVCSSPSSRVD